MKQTDEALAIRESVNHYWPGTIAPLKNNQNFSQYELTAERQIAVIFHEGSELSRLPASMDHFALVLCLQGNATRTINHFRFSVAPGSIHLAFPHTLNAWHNASEDLKLHMLFFKREFLADAMIRETGLEAMLDAHTGDLLHSLLTSESFEVMSTLFHKLDGEVNQEKLFQGQMMRLLFLELMLEARRLCGEPTLSLVKSAGRPVQLTAAFKKLVEDYYLELRTVQEYADQLFVTAKHLSETVKHETGVSPLHTIHNRLFQDARYLLCTTDMTIKQIGDKLNFDTASHFTRFFKQYSGYNPTAFKQMQCAF